MLRGLCRRGRNAFRAIWNYKRESLRCDHFLASGSFKYEARARIVGIVKAHYASLQMVIRSVHLRWLRRCRGVWNFRGFVGSLWPPVNTPPARSKYGQISVCEVAQHVCKREAFAGACDVLEFPAKVCCDDGAWFVLESPGAMAVPSQISAVIHFWSSGSPH